MSARVTSVDEKEGEKALMAPFDSLRRATGS